MQEGNPEHAACGHLGGVLRHGPVGLYAPPRFSAGEQYLARSGRLSAATTPMGSGLRSTSFGVVGASRPPGQGKVERSASKPGNQQGCSRSARRGHWLGHACTNKSKLLKRTYARLSKPRRQPRLRHQSSPTVQSAPGLQKMPSRKQRRPKQLGQRLRSLQQAIGKRSCALLRATCSIGRVD